MPSASKPFAKLMQRALPEQVRVIDFGIRSYDLAYAMIDGYDSIILVDATSRGYAPGTVYLIEPDLSRLNQIEAEQPRNAHGDESPSGVLAGGAITRRCTGRALSRGLYEPAILENEGGEIGLSEKVGQPMPKAIEAASITDQRFAPGECHKY